MNQGEQLGVVILAAGLGKRMRSEQAKVLHRLAGKPLLSHIVHATQRLHPDRLVVVVGHQADAVQEACGGAGISFAIQRQQRGTGDAVLAAQAAFVNWQGNVLIVCGDTPLLTTPTLAAFVQQHRAEQCVLSVLSVRMPDPAQYGRVIRTRSSAAGMIVGMFDLNKSKELPIYIVHGGKDFLLRQSSLKPRA